MTTVPTRETDAIPLRSRVVVVCVLAAVHSLAYEFFNRRSGGPTPIYLPLTALDRATPLLPWTIWPYLVLIPAGPVLALWIRSRAVFRRVLATYALTMVCAAVFYAVMPTLYPRPEPDFPVRTLSSVVWTRFMQFDTPLCAFPSGHVVAPLSATLGLAREGRGLWPLALVAGASLSLLTTKQHYAWDIAGGALLVLGAWWLLGRLSAAFPGRLA